MTPEKTTPPDVDTSPARMKELAKAEQEAGVVDQQAAAAAAGTDDGADD